MNSMNAEPLQAELYRELLATVREHAGTLAEHPTPWSDDSGRVVDARGCTVWDYSDSNDDPAAARMVIEIVNQIAGETQ
jgi:hypothetical protein